MITFLSILKRRLARYLFILTNYRRIRQVGGNLAINGRVVCLGHNLSIGDSVSINEGVILNARVVLTIGDYCRISPLVQIHTGGLDIEQSYKKRRHIAAPVHIEEGVWLCAGVIVLPGVTVGKGSVVAAGSVVNADIPEYELWGGVPAKKIKSLPRS